MPVGSADQKADSLISALFTKDNVLLSLFAAVLIPISLSLHEHAKDSFIAELLGHLLRDVSIAIYISILLAVFIERSHRQELMTGLDNKIEKLTDSVFSGVFKADLPAALISEVINLILKQQVVRENWRITYSLTDKETTSHGRYTELQARNSYRLRNVSFQTAQLTIGLSLPNPIFDELRKMVRIEQLKINGVDIALDDKNKQVQEAMRASVDNAKSVLYQTSLEPKQSIEVSLFYTMIKEREDSEVLRSYFPSDGIDVNIIDETDHTRTLGALSVHRLPLEDRTPPGDSKVRSWVLPYYILPKQGIIFWWKRGEPQLVSEQAVQNQSQPEQQVKQSPGV